jgi:hypothetical protein
MAKLFVSDVEAEMYSLLNQLAELNGCSLEEEFGGVLRWSAEEAESEEGEQAPQAEKQDVRLLITRKAGELKTS